MTVILKEYLDKYCQQYNVRQIAIGIPATLSADREEILQVPNIKGMDHMFLGRTLEKIWGFPWHWEKMLICYISGITMRRIWQKKA
ncbi:MAG: hypothetical protein ACLR4C_04820 [Eubacterium ventriosum]